MGTLNYVHHKRATFYNVDRCFPRTSSLAREGRVGHGFRPRSKITLAGSLGMQTYDFNTAAIWDFCIFRKLQKATGIHQKLVEKHKYDLKTRMLLITKN